MFELEYESEDLIPAEVRHLYVQDGEKFAILGESKLKTVDDVNKVKADLVKERNAHKATKQKWSDLADEDPEEVRTRLDKLAELEAEAPKDGENKNDDDETLELKIKARTAPLQRELDKLAKERDELAGTVDDYKKTETQRKIRDHIREEATKSKMIPEFIDDALDLGVHLFELNDEGDVVTRDGVRATPGVDAGAWLTERRDKNPLWWPESQGAGSRGNESGGQGGINPFTAAHWNVTEQMNVVRQNPTRAENMAKMAGTTVGGTKPAEK